MKTASCPSCGAAVRFRAFASKAAICEFCKTTVVRSGVDVEAIGVMADVSSDPTPIQINTGGRFRGKSFTVIGRLQYEYQAGRWNEWCVMFEPERLGWLTEAQGEYTLVLPAKGKLPPLPAFDAIKPGDRFKLGDKDFEAADIQRAKVVGGEGELPFKVDSGYEAPVVDLKSEEGLFATLDFSDGAPVLYVGESLDFKDFQFQNLANTEYGVQQEKVRAREFKCLGCGAPLTRRSKDIKTVACGSCGTVVDTAADTYKIVAKVEQAKGKLSIPPGKVGRFNGADFEMIGAMQRTAGTGPDSYTWTEYLLSHPEHGYRWLSEYNGHFSFISPLKKRPQAGKTGDATYLGNVYKHFASYTGRVTFVAGEFYWQVKVDAEAVVSDFIRPPGMLSREVDDHEQTWSHAEYRTGEEVWKAFKLEGKPPAAVGVAPNQPSPFVGEVARHWGWYILFALLAVIVHAAIGLFSGSTVAREEVVLSNRKQVLLTPFEVKKAAPLDVSFVMGESNVWADLDIALVDKAKSVVATSEHAFSYYAGVDGGESWREGTQELDLSFGQIQPGTYFLSLEAELPPDKPTVLFKIKVKSGGGGSFLSVVLFWLVMLVFPIIAIVRSASFEKRRWAESDHAGGDDDDE
jgi:hypothetical protein